MRTRFSFATAAALMATGAMLAGAGSAAAGTSWDRPANDGTSWDSEATRAGEDSRPDGAIRHSRGTSWD